MKADRIFGLLGLLTAIALIITPGSVSASDQPPLVIGTGGVAGAYYPAGGALAFTVNRHSGESGIRLAVEPSLRASADNINGLLSGRLQLGLVQSDIQNQVMKKEGGFASIKGGEKLHSLFSLYSEAFTVVVAKDSGIQKFADLRGQRVAMGDPSASFRVTSEMFMAEFGLTADQVLAASGIRADDMTTALCSGQVDAFIYAIGHPHNMIKTAVTECGGRILSLEGQELTSFTGKHPYYQPTSLTAGLYGENSPAVQTFGPKAVVTATTDLSDDTAYLIVKTVFENFDSFKNMLPIFSNLTKEDMIKGHIIELHPGAVRYYREAGLLSE